MAFCILWLPPPSGLPHLVAVRSSQKTAGHGGDLVGAPKKDRG